MGNKTHPYSMRLGITKDWQSRWFSLKPFKIFLREDYVIREYLDAKLKKMGVNSIEIERTGNQINTIIKTSRPGLIIGRGGTGVETLRKELVKILKNLRSAMATLPSLGFHEKELLLNKFELKLQIDEIRDPECYATIVGNNIVEQIEKRTPFRRIVKQTLEKVSAVRGVEGIKILISGRLDGSEIARKEMFHKGKIPLSTLRASIDYANVVAFCTYGTIGIKVWIYKGEVFK